MQWVEEVAQLTGEKQREFFQFYYAANTWKRRRKLIAKLEVTGKGRNPRFILRWRLNSNPDSPAECCPGT